jgi:hypothetical protein
MWKPSRSAEKSSKLAVPINPGYRCEHLAWVAAGGSNPRNIMIWVDKGEDKGNESSSRGIYGLFYLS